MSEQFMNNKGLIELIFTGIAGIGLLIIILFSSPIEKLRDKIKIHKEKKRQERIEERKEALLPLTEEIKEVKKEIFDLSVQVENLQEDMDILKKADQEQLRQWMDHIYFKHLDDKIISQHNFDRYESLQSNYEAEGGNGTYSARWEEVKTWKKTK